MAGDAEQLHCMEVWGGSSQADRAVQMAGLDAWVYSKPFKSCDTSSADVKSISASSAATSEDAATAAAEAAGGDVYYASSCATGRIHRLLLADVAGHGAAVVDIASQLRALMRRYVNCIDQKQFVRSMNRQFSRASAEGCFATALVTTYFAPTQLLTICNAGHPRPFLFRAKDATWTILEKSPTAKTHRIANIPLGIIDAADYEQFDVQLCAGDLVVCYTDALIESKDVAGNLLGESGVLEILRTLSIEAPRQLMGALLAEIARLDKRNLLADDITVLTLRASISPRRARLKHKAGGALRFLSELSHGRAPMPDLRLANLGGAIFSPLSRRWRGGNKVDGQQ